MSDRLPPPDATADDPGLDYARLYTSGLQHIRRLAERVWTDFNLHDPGVTTLELLCYALTDLAHRAAHPVEDLLAEPGGAAADVLYSARRVLPNRPLTVRDYRKLLIDLPGVRNAWIEPLPVRLAPPPDAAADSVAGAREAIVVRGLYAARVDCADDVGDAAAHAALLDEATRRLHAHRNLCEDFAPVTEVLPQPFVLCGELELAPDADVARVEAEVWWAVGRHLAPPVRRYSLAEMLARTTPDGRPYTVAEIFAGPGLAHGFIDDDELEAAALPTAISLSDVFRVVMAVPGVVAVRDLLVTPAAAEAPPANRWRVPVEAGRQPILSRLGSRLVHYKGHLPVTADAARVAAHLTTLEQAAPVAATLTEDLPVPTGRRRHVSRYTSLQHHYPAVYGLADQMPKDPSGARAAEILNLQAYLLFFDQVLANYVAQLGIARRLLSIDADLPASYAVQPVVPPTVPLPADGSTPTDTAIEAASAYRPGALADLRNLAVVAASRDLDRRHRFLDHLLARFAERFHEYAAVIASRFPATADQLLAAKRAFLRAVPELGAARGLGPVLPPPGAVDPWETGNVAGLVRRVAALLGMRTADRRPLAELDETAIGDEGMHVVEHILLRPLGDDPHLRPCEGDGAECGGDPYSYRLRVLLPAYAGRFVDMDFRRFVEETIRRETPAHLLPTICWISRDDMRAFEDAYRGWLAVAPSAEPSAERRTALTALLEVLYTSKNVYPPTALGECGIGDETRQFILGRSALGSGAHDDQ